ncbi:hypothetical protein L1987_45447 [Smallanthus sonchifolius]|uniref:Uncharacterized protein n=1 Tax=Smallanthus sonchifolius TaxID=185202 RepID=A0ACB9FY25_9ASTR|nr:hypothetical protein L1987_45447 [Smallanthus sonchifolius]
MALNRSEACNSTVTKVREDGTEQLENLCYQIKNKKSDPMEFRVLILCWKLVVIHWVRELKETVRLLELLIMDFGAKRYHHHLCSHPNLVELELMDLRMISLLHWLYPFASFMQSHGGTYMLNKPEYKVEFEDGKVVGVTSEEETAKCKKVVCDHSYLPDKVNPLPQSYDEHNTF